MTGREPPPGQAGGQRWVVLGTWFLAAVSGFMVITYVGMTPTSSMPFLMACSFANGVAWGFFPILSTVPFRLRGIRLREIAVAIVLLTVMTSLGFLLGPLAAGFLAGGYRLDRAANREPERRFVDRHRHGTAPRFEERGDQGLGRPRGPGRAMRLGRLAKSLRHPSTRTTPALPTWP